METFTQEQRNRNLTPQTALPFPPHSSHLQRQRVSPSRVSLSSASAHQSPTASPDKYRAPWHNSPPLTVPLADCRQPARPGAGVQLSPWPERRSRTRACLWSQTWPRPAARSGSWRSLAWEAGSWYRSRQPLGRSTEEPLGWRCRCSAASGCLRSPVH